MNELVLLSQVPLFASLPRDELEHLVTTLRSVEVESETFLFREGDHGDCFYVISAGQVEVIKALGTPSERWVGVRGPGEFIGEMSLLNREGRRTASVRAVGDARLLGMTRSDFDALLYRQPTLAYEMVRVLSARLQASHEDAIRDLQEKNRQLMQAYEELRAAQAHIIEKEKLERELELARKIQMSILPRELLQLTGFDSGSRIVPMTAIGGDFFDFIPLGSDTFGIAVGDVSGHGVPAALFMALTTTLLRAEACHNCSPSEVLRSVNRQLLNVNDEGMFVTVLYGVLNCTTREFTYARAGHDLPILCHGSGECVEPAFASGVPLGVLHDLLVDEQTLIMAPGDTLLLYTDGASEARDAHQAMFGTERLREAVVAHGRSSAQVVCDRILEQVMSHSASVAQQDDITLVCVRAC